MSLTDVEVRNAKPKAKPYQISDGDGLSLLVNTNGGKWWRFRYLFQGKAKMLSLGTYPDVPLKRARDKCADARALVADGIDPSARRKSDKLALVNTFEGVAREWFTAQKNVWVPSHASRVLGRLENDVFPYIGSEPISTLKPAHILSVLRRVEKRGAIESAHRIQQVCGAICRYAVHTERAESNVCADLKGALPPTQVEHHASIVEPKLIGALLRAIDDYDGFPVVKAALQLAPLVFVRPGELRHAEWKEFDFDKAEWRIPADKMKMGAPHIVPLSKQAIAILRNIQPVTRRSRYVFPSARSAARPMSDNALNAALRRMGYEQGSMTAHGFRSMASTILNEQGFNRDWIERQLAHGERNEVRGAYNYAEYLPDRRTMMQHWSDYLASLRIGA